MSDLRSRVRSLLLKDRLTVQETAKRLRVPPAQVVALMNEARVSDTGESRPDSEVAPRECVPSGEAEQIALLRRKVRAALLDRFEDFPPAVLLRLWQLVEDPKLLSGETDCEEDPFDLPEELKEEVFRVLDQGLFHSGDPAPG